MIPSASVFWEIFYHTIAIYAFLIIAMRLFAHRILGQLTVIDFIVVLLLGSAVQTPMISDNSLIAGLFCAALLLGLNRLIGVIARHSPKWQFLTGGTPLVLIRSGRIIRENLKRCGLSEGDLIQSIRKRGVQHIGQVAYAVMELDGEITVVEKDATIHRTIRKHHPHAATPT